ncbi:MAG: flagellar hook-basal body complex protein [Verrucomicrobiota bacterium]|nr:flagellar hook-basal body complex protein [Verrucomicrobiota bacterium]
MIRSLNTGVLGIKQFQTSLDAIGNNLANINTIGFKGARVDFSDTLAQTMRAPTPDTDTTSGAAGMQVGNGVTVSAIKNQFTQGAIKQTGVRTDMAITGEGYFLVKDATTNELYATRAGDFREDKNGFLITNDGHRVQGLNKQAPANTAAEKLEIGDLKLDVGKYTEDRASIALNTSTNVFTKNAHGYTTGNQVKFSGTLPSVAGGSITTSSVYFVAKATDDTFTLHNTAADAASGANSVNFTVASPASVTVSSVTYGSDYLTLATGHGLSTGDTVYVSGGTVPGGTTDGKVYYARVSGNNIYLHNSSTDATNGTSTVDLTSTGSGFTFYKDTGTVSSLTLTGGASISSYSVGADGKVNMLLTDGTQYVRGQVLLQNFKNPQALLKQGSNLYGNLATAGPEGITSQSAGATEILSNAKAPGSSGMGRLAAGSLELSNVDMAREFSSMITTQRAFQANARVISTSDEILKEMMALKR